MCEYVFLVSLVTYSTICLGVLERLPAKHNEYEKQRLSLYPSYVLGYMREGEGNSHPTLFHAPLENWQTRICYSFGSRT